MTDRKQPVQPNITLFSWFHVINGHKQTENTFYKVRRLTFIYVIKKYDYKDIKYYILEKVRV